MKTMFLSSMLFQHVLESDLSKVVVLVNDNLKVGDKLEVIEGRENCKSLRSIRIFRYVSNIFDCEMMTSNDYIIYLELSATQISSKSPHFGKSFSPFNHTF